MRGSGIALQAIVLLGVVVLAPVAPAAGMPGLAPTVGVFPVTYLSQQQVLTGRVISDAVPVPPADLRIALTLEGEPVGGSAAVSATIEYSCDGGRRSFAIGLPPGDTERERDKLCPECASLPAPPSTD